MKCAFTRHLSLFWLNKYWWFSLFQSWLVFHMVSIEIPFPVPRNKMGGKEIIEYILCELVSIIWILPAFELHCWTHLLLCHCSSISQEINVPSRVARMLGKERASLACCHPGSAACRDNWHSLLCASTAGGQMTYRQEDGLQTWRSKTLVLWGSPPQTFVDTSVWFLCLWDSVSQSIK